MKLGIITYHSAHNFGSMLQAYALQYVLGKMGHKCEIINFRSKRQRDFYVPFYAYLSTKTKFAIRLLFPSMYYGAKKKYLLFEKFIRENLPVSSVEFHSLEELEQSDSRYDAYISGSDQIWNIFCFDWNPAYCFPFVESARKIAYAPSMGGQLNIAEILKSEKLELFKDAIKKYHAISVRERQTADIIQMLTGKRPQVTLDPALLLDSTDWKLLESEGPIVKGEYILLYTPWQNDALYDKAIAIGRKMKMKIVVSMHYGFRKYCNNSTIIFKEATGPKEFLNLIRYSRLVIGASFHAAAFAVIFGKQLYAYEGNNDARVASLLNMVELKQFYEEPESIIESNKLKDMYSEAYKKLDSQRVLSFKYLKESLS